MENSKIISYKNVVVILATLAIIALCIFALDIILMLFAAFVITCAINPIINRMEKVIPRVWAITLILFALILASFLILVPLVTISAKEAVELVDNFPSVIFQI